MSKCTMLRELYQLYNCDETWKLFQKPQFQKERDFEEDKINGQIVDIFCRFHQSQSIWYKLQGQS